MSTDAISEIDRENELGLTGAILEVMNEVHRTERIKGRFAQNGFSLKDCLVIKTEEDLEVAQAINKQYEVNQIYKELTQVAAVCLMMMKLIRPEVQNG